MLFTSSKHPQKQIFKYSDDSAILSWLHQSEHLHPWSQWGHCVVWPTHFNLNTKKTRELIFDPRKTCNHTLVTSTISQSHSYNLLQRSRVHVGVKGPTLERGKPTWIGSGPGWCHGPRGENTWTSFHQRPSAQFQRFDSLKMNAASLLCCVFVLTLGCPVFNKLMFIEFNTWLFSLLHFGSGFQLDSPSHKAGFVEKLFGVSDTKASSLLSIKDSGTPPVSCVQSTSCCHHHRPSVIWSGAWTSVGCSRSMNQKLRREATQERQCERKQSVGCCVSSLWQLAGHMKARLLPPLFS